MLEITPLGPALGAEVKGVNWSQGVGSGVVQQCRQAWHDHQLLVFRDQQLTPETFTAFGKAFGQLEVVKTYSGLPEHPEVMPLIKEPHDKVNVGEGWHIDSTYRSRPPAGAALYGIDIPERGGDTLFSNMYLAFDTLSVGLKDLLRQLRAVHANGFLGDPSARAERATQQSMAVMTDIRVETAEHPVVRVHPATGEESLFINKQLDDGGMLSHFVGMSVEESAPLVSFLCEHAAQEEFTYRLSWEPGTIALYDNRCLQHNAPNDYQGQRRELWRLSIEGDVPR